MSPSADLGVVNARVVGAVPPAPRATALAIRAGRIVAVGALADVRGFFGVETEVIDAGGAWAVPAFHDAHLHLLSYARMGAKLDCAGLRSLGELGGALGRRAATRPSGAWVRAVRYDETSWIDGRHPDRYDLDAAVPEHPVHLRHRALHLDVFNTAALRRLQLTDLPMGGLERDPRTGAPTGRVYHAGDRLHQVLEHPTYDELARSVRDASERLLAWGVTSVQDASITNGPAEWTLFHRLAADGYLPLRVFFMPGVSSWRQIPWADAPSARVRQGPVKLMVEEGATDPSQLRAAVASVRGAGRAVALHAVTEAEVALAVDALGDAGARPPAPPSRIEHGAVIPDQFLGPLREAGVFVVGQPSLVHDRGDVYRAEFPPELHPWLHRAGSLVAAGVRYAASSDAPVTEPIPGVGLAAARRRLTASGAPLGTDEALGPLAALAAFTRSPAEAVGASGALGRVRPGAIADVVLLDDEVLEGTDPVAARRPVRMTVMDGRVVWRRPDLS